MVKNLDSLIWTKLETPIKWMEATWFFSSKESVPYTMCCEGDFHCGIWHWWGNTEPWSTSKVDGKRCLLLKVPSATPSSSAQKKTMKLGGTEPHRPLWQCKESHHWEILEHPPHSPNMSPCDYNLFVKVKEALWGMWYNTYPCYRVVNMEHQQSWWCTAPSKHLQKVTINKGWATILKIHKWCTPVNEAMSEISNCCHYFLSNLCRLYHRQRLHA